MAGSADAIAELFDILGDRIAYLYFGNAERIDPVFVVEEPVHCQPLKVYTSGSQAGLRVCFQWMLSLGTERLDQLLEALCADPRVAEELKGVAAAQFRRRPTITFEVLTQPGVASHVARCLVAILDRGESSEH